LKGIRDQAAGGTAEKLESVENEKTILPIVPPAISEVIDCLNHNNFLIFRPYDHRISVPFLKPHQKLPKVGGPQVSSQIASPQICGLK
jgi:hypothetical protein